ncbi:hypothetical protein LTR12_014711 [Friedmanniomyces endolithicus]|nr:hypothetical protein LTR12_014711 [Friedmanniomyces endolithicus]
MLSDNRSGSTFSLACQRTPAERPEKPARKELGAVLPQVPQKGAPVKQELGAFVDGPGFDVETLCNAVDWETGLVPTTEKEAIPSCGDEVREGGDE